MTKTAVSVTQLPMFDLSYVVDQLSHKPEYSGWDPERFKAAVEEYRKFLALCRLYPDQVLVPGRDVETPLPFGCVKHRFLGYAKLKSNHLTG